MGLGYDTARGGANWSGDASLGTGTGGLNSPSRSVILLSYQTNPMTNTEYQIQTIIDSIDDMQKVINVARRDFEGIDTVEDCSYPFAAGYTSAGLSNIKYTLCQLLK